MSRVAIISDCHLPDHHRLAWNLTLKILPELNIDSIYGPGDWFDLPQLGKYLVPPDRMMTLRHDIKQTQKELTRLRIAMPDVPIEIHEGNHESRYWKTIWSKIPQLAGISGHSLDEAFQLDYFDIQWHPAASGFRRIGKLLLIHGDELKVGSVDIARKIYLKVNENVMAGHYHAQDSYIHTLGGSLKNEGAWINSCLRSLRPNWAPFSNWTLGFSICDFSIGGFFNVQQILYLKRGSGLWCKVDGMEFTI